MIDGNLKIVSYVGAVGSGKTTAVNSWDPDAIVAFRPGEILRGAVGLAPFRSGDQANSPVEMDLFVWESFRHHVMLAREMDRRFVVCDGWPRNRMQALALLGYLGPHEAGYDLSAQVTQLAVSEETWRVRLMKTRWRDHPETKTMDVHRFYSSLDESAKVVSVLRLNIGCGLVDRLFIETLCEGAYPVPEVPRDGWDARSVNVDSASAGQARHVSG